MKIVPYSYTAIKLYKIYSKLFWLVAYLRTVLPNPYLLCIRLEKMKLTTFTNKFTGRRKMALKKYISIFGIVLPSLLFIGVFIVNEHIPESKMDFIKPAFAEISELCKVVDMIPVDAGLFMEISDLDTDDIKLKGYSFKHVTSSSQSGKQNPTTKIFFGNFVITKNLDSSSTKLINAFSSKQVLDEINILACFGSAFDPTKYTIKLENAVVCSYDQISDGSEKPPMEEIGFCWEKMITEYTPSKAEGGVVTESVTDLKNKKDKG